MINRTNKFYVYYLIDPRNNNVFWVGKGSGDRMTKHEYLTRMGYFSSSNNKKLFNKIQKILKIGKKIIYKKILENVSEKRAFKREIVEIIKLKQKGINLCNLTIGGEGTSGHTYIVSDKIKKKMSKLFKGKNNPFYGKTHSEETRKTLSEIGKTLKGNKNPFYGKFHSKETKLKLSKNHLGKRIGIESPRWKFINEKDRIKIIDYYKKFGMNYTINKFSNKQYKYDVIKRVLIETGVYKKYGKFN